MLIIKKLLQKKYKYSFVLILFFCLFYAYYNFLSWYNENDKKYLAIRDFSLSISEQLISIPLSIINQWQQVKQSADSFLFTYQKNQQLKEQIETLERKAIDYEIIKNENILLKESLNYAKEKISKSYTTYQIAGYSADNDNRELILITNGNLLREGKLVFNSKGVIGRVKNCSTKYAEILLINDEKSILPAQTIASHAEDNQKFMVEGYSTNLLRIKYLNNNLPTKGGKFLNIGDLVLSSGEGDLIDDGVPIGRIVSHNNNEYLVKSFNDFNNLKFVFIFDEQ
jgi:cell shape-determining protein MreC